MVKPGRHPPPTAAFQKRSLSTIRVAKTHKWLRLYREAYSPLHFGMTKGSRFDAPDQSYGVLYIARQLPGAFVETLCRDASTLRPISEESINTYHVAEIRASRGLKLADLAGKGLVRMGLDSRLSSGDYRIAQRWSEAIYQHPDNVDGIIYPSRHDPKQQAVALFDRAETLLSVRSGGALRDYLGNQDFFALLDHYGVALL